ncbi:MAG: ABC transporter ATP-binding protein [Phycisphaeraceae bacterium]|nr:MAG: ABC transporter ATP-binding protein [Phycisphaeraceae bacterium]
MQTMVKPASGEYVIDLDLVSKTYKGDVQALREVSMRVHRGEIFGLLGPNGAGKSTLVKVLLTIVRPTKCSGGMLGEPVGHKPTLARVGYLPEHLRFPDYLTGEQAVDYFGALAGTPRRRRRENTDRLLALVGMEAWRKKKIKGYSKGMKQRIGIAQALMNDPDIVFLDEPTDGVDPVGRRDIRNLIVALRDEGKTVFVNSHLLSELEMVSDRVAILVQGVVAKQGTIDELTSDQRRYEIGCTPAPGSNLLQSLRAVLPARFEPTPEGETPTRLVGALNNTGESIEVLPMGLITIGSADPERAQPVIDALRGAGATIRFVRPHRPSLEDLFMQAVTDPETGEALLPGAADQKKKPSRPASAGGRS